MNWPPQRRAPPGRLATALICAPALAGCPQALVKYPAADSAEVTEDDQPDEVPLGSLSGWAVVGERPEEAVGGTPAVLLAGDAGVWTAAVVTSPAAGGGGGLLSVHALDDGGPRALRAGASWAGVAGARLGAAVVALGGPAGVGRLAVGAPGEGAVYLFASPAPGAALQAPQRIAVQLQRAGSALSAADFDSDGLADLAVGAPGDDAAPGWVGVHLGEASALGLSALPDLELVGLFEGDQLGASLAAADFTGDGAADLIACAPGYDTAESNVGACALIEGGATFTAPLGDLRARAAGFFLGAERGLRLGDGAGVLAAADLDGDLRAELVLGAPAGAGGEGAVAVFFGDRPPGLRTVADADLVVSGSGGFGQSLALLPASEGSSGRIIVSAATTGSVVMLPVLDRGAFALDTLAPTLLGASPPSDRLGATLTVGWASGGALLLLGAPGVDGAGFSSGELRAAPIGLGTFEP